MEQSRLDLLEYGKDSVRDSTKLESFVRNLSSDAIESLLKAVLSNGKSSQAAPQVVLYLFKGMDQSSQAKRLVASKTLLKELQSSTKISVVMRAELLCSFTLSVDKFSSMELVALIDLCLESIEKNSDKNTTWKDLLPKLLNVGGDKEEVLSCGTPMKGVQYKTRIFERLIGQNWKEETLVPLAIMFIDVTLPQDLHMEVVRKFCCYLIELPPNELATLAQQLMILCRDRNSIPLFLSLQAYFTKWVYQAPPDSQDPDSIDRADFYKEAPSEEANVRLWIKEAATHGSSSVKELLKYAKSLVQAPEALLEPFFVTVLLALSKLSSCRNVDITSILKAAIIRACQEQKKVAESAWMGAVVPQTYELEDVFVEVINKSHDNNEDAMEGIIDLAFMLLAVRVSPSIEQCLARQLWALGQKMIVHLVKKKTSELGGKVLDRIFDSLQGSQPVTQFISCLAEMVRTSPTVVSDQFGSVTNMIAKIKNMGVAGGVAFVKALMPVMRNNLSMGDNKSHRDCLIITLKKDLIASQVATRLVAVPCFIHVITCLEVKNLTAISHSQASSTQLTSRRTQVCVESTTRFEEDESTYLVCLRVLNRCLDQQAEVRLALYSGLCECTSNSEILSYVQNMLLGHANNYYIDGDALPPLDFQHVAIVHDAGAQLREPLAHLVYALHRVTRGKQTSASGANLLQMLTSLTNRMAQCTLEDLGLTDATELQDILPESLMKREMVSQMIGVYEALMCHVVGTWTTRTQDQGKTLVSLYKGYDRLVKFCTSINKAKKADPNETRKAKAKKGDESMTKKRDGNAAVQKAIPYKLPTSLMDYATVDSLLKLIHQDSVEWSTEPCANQVKGQRDLRRYVSQVALNLVKSPGQVYSPRVMETLISIGRTLYEYVICQLLVSMEYDAGIAALSVECFGEILHVVDRNFKGRQKDFFSEVAGTVRSRDSQVASPLMRLIRRYQLTLSDLVGQEHEDDDPASKAIPLNIVAGLRFLVEQVEEKPEEVLEWLWKFCLTTEINNVIVAKSVFELLCTVQNRYKGSPTWFDRVSTQLLYVIGREDGETVAAPATQLSLVTNNNANQTLVTLCKSMRQTLAEIDWVIVRLRSESNALQYSADATARDRKLKEMEREANIHFSYIVKVVNNLTKIQCPDDASAETTLLGLLASLYTTVTNLTKYFFTRATKLNAASIFQQTKYETLVKLVGIHLSESVNQFISDVQNKDISAGKGGSKATLKQKKRVRDEEKILPAVTFNKESFETALIKLSSKCGVDLMAGLKSNSARDFRIKKSVLQSMETTANVSVAESVCGDQEDQEPKKKKARKS